MLAAVLLLGTTVISGLSTANAENKNHEDKVKLDCLDAIFANSLMSFVTDSVLFLILSISASSPIIIVGLRLDIKGAN